MKRFLIINLAGRDMFHHDAHRIAHQGDNLHAHPGEAKQRHCDQDQFVFPNVMNCRREQNTK